MQSDVWGTNFHDTMMFLALDLGDSPSQNEVKDTCSLIQSLAEHVPCPKCKAHAIKYFSNHPFICRNTDDVVQYLVTFRNSVNARLQKDDTWTVDRALEAFYQRHYGIGYFVSQLDFKRREDFQTVSALRNQVRDLQSKLPPD